MCKKLMDNVQMKYHVKRSTVKPVCNDHLCNKIYYLWFIQ